MMHTWSVIPLGGQLLRYELFLVLRARRGAMTVGEIAAAIEADGFALAGRASKAVSDALRWEVAAGRAIRLGRGRYCAGFLEWPAVARRHEAVAWAKREAAAGRAWSRADRGFNGLPPWVHRGRNPPREEPVYV